MAGWRRCARAVHELVYLHHSAKPAASEGGGVGEPLLWLVRWGECSLLIGTEETPGSLPPHSNEEP